MIRFLVADDNAVIRAGIASVLRADPHLTAVGEASTGAEAVAMTQRLRPDIVLLDVHLPGPDGVNAAATIAKSARLLVLSFAADDETVTRAVRAGARGYLVHGRFEPDELAAAVRAVAAGGSVLSPAVAGAVLTALRAEPRPLHRTGPYGLTDRERELMGLVARGQSNQTIARELFITHKTVKNHLNSAYAKLGVTSRAEAIAVWLGVVGSRAPAR